MRAGQYAMGRAPGCVGRAAGDAILSDARIAGRRKGGHVEQLLPIIVGLAIIWVVWKVVKGIIRLVLTVLIIGAVLYFVVLPLLA
jgi:hypothetical protein